jgi:hypothetical protein
MKGLHLILNFECVSNVSRYSWYHQGLRHKSSVGDCPRLYNLLCVRQTKAYQDKTRHYCGAVPTYVRTYVRASAALAVLAILHWIKSNTLLLQNIGR